MECFPLAFLTLFNRMQPGKSAHAAAYRAAIRLGAVAFGELLARFAFATGHRRFRFLDGRFAGWSRFRGTLLWRSSGRTGPGYFYISELQVRKRIPQHR